MLYTLVIQVSYEYNHLVRGVYESHTKLENPSDLYIKYKVLWKHTKVYKLQHANI